MFSYYNIKKFSFVIIISLLIGIIPINFYYYFINLNNQQIVLKIKGGGDRNIFCSEGSFYDINHPDYVRYNNKKYTTFNNPHYFNGDINTIHTVILEWEYPREDYSHLFHACPDITEIDLTSFDTSGVKLMGSMFRECHSLTSIKFANFKTNKVEDMGFLFQNCKKLTSIDLSIFDTSHVTQMWYMFAGCSSLTSLDLSKFDTSQVTSMEAMFENCLSLTSLNINNFYITSVSVISNIFNNCVNLEYINLFNFIGNKLDSADNMFGSVPNNLVVCINTNKINNKILDELETKLCHTKIEDCEMNWKMIQKKILKSSGLCVDSCNNKYEYENKCYNSCPEGTKDDGNKKCKCYFDKCLECPGEAYYKKLCTVCNNGYYKKEYDQLNTDKYIECYNNLKGFYLDTKELMYRECYYKCETCEKGGTDSNPNCLKCKANYECVTNDNKKTELINDINQNTETKTKNIEVNNDIYNINDILKEINNLPKNEESNGYYDSILEIIESFFSLNIYDTSNIDKGVEEQISIGKMQVTLTTSETQKNNIYNDSYITNNTLIDLAKCEISLRSSYHMSNDTSLYIQKIDVIQDGMQIPKVEYDVYSRLDGKKLQKLNLSICGNDKINIYTNIDSISNIDIVNPTSGYYTDICYPTTSDVGTDITLDDRKKEFVEKNKTVCQEDCVFVGYNYKTKKANCSCDVKESSGFFENIVINRKKLYQNFLDINTIANVDFLLCYKMLFCKKGLLKNIGSYILLFFILLHIVCIIIFYTKSFPKLKKKINCIFSSKVNLITTKDDKGNKNKKLKYKTFKIKKHKRKKKYKKRHSKKNNNKKLISSNTYLNIFKYTDDEINDLSYELAIKKDKRTYFQYYISLIKTKHDIFFSFFYNKDYNAKIIKIDLFFLGFIFSYVTNGLFFDDETMHKIYKDEGSFDFLYQLPKTIYSSIISLFFEYVFKLLPLSNDIILDFKNSKLTHKKAKKNLKIKLRIKFLLYFIISTICLILFWYYIGMFGVIYKNTQIYLIQDTIFSFIESSIYPFWINLLPGIFRIPALSNQKNKRRYLYRFSQFLQIL